MEATWRRTWTTWGDGDPLPRRDSMPTPESGSDRISRLPCPIYHIPSPAPIPCHTPNPLALSASCLCCALLFVISLGCGLLSAVGICHIATVASSGWQAMGCKSVAGWGRGKRKSCQFKWVQPAFWHLSLSWAPNVASVWWPLRDPQTAWRRLHPEPICTEKYIFN